MFVCSLCLKAFSLVENDPDWWSWIFSLYQINIDRDSTFLFITLFSSFDMLENICHEILSCNIQVKSKY